MFENVNFDKNETLKLWKKKKKKKSQKTNWNLEQRREKVLVTLFVLFTFSVSEFFGGRRKALVKNLTEKISPGEKSREFAGYRRPWTTFSASSLSQSSAKWDFDTAFPRAKNPGIRRVPASVDDMTDI